MTTLLEQTYQWRHVGDMVTKFALPSRMFSSLASDNPLILSSVVQVLTLGKIRFGSCFFLSLLFVWCLYIYKSGVGCHSLYVTCTGYMRVVSIVQRSSRAFTRHWHSMLTRKIFDIFPSVTVGVSDSRQTHFACLLTNPLLLTNSLRVVGEQLQIHYFD